MYRYNSVGSYMLRGINCILRAASKLLICGFGYIKFNARCFAYLRLKRFNQRALLLFKQQCYALLGIFLWY
ncbi:hypothetical protein B4901_05915 [Yersinia frederiksenii]|nr:hypothetical protein B4901_05915 [Yersinia frederiksenii]